MNEKTFSTETSENRLEIEALNSDGWISDCPRHKDVDGKRQRIKSCREPGTDTAIDKGPNLCKVKLSDLKTTDEHTIKCVGPSEVRFDPTLKTMVKYCQRVLERESIHCPCESRKERLFQYIN